MNLVRLRYFLAVAEELHFGRAAEKLHMAQPPLSQQIRQLEKEFDLTLFDRTTRRVELTTAGRLLRPEAERLLAQADAIDRLMAEHRAGSAGVLRLGFVDSASYEVMPRLLRSYRERWPAVRLELLTMSSDDQVAALLAGDLDLGIARSRGGEPGITHTVIAEEPLLLAVRTGHALAQQDTASLHQLESEPLIGFTRSKSPALSQELAGLLEASGVAYEPVIEAEEYTTIIGLVAAGEGVAVVPAAVRSFQPSDLVYLPLRDPEATTTLMMLTREADPLRVVEHALALARELF